MLHCITLARSLSFGLPFFPLLVYLAGMKSVLHETASVSVIHTISAGYLSTVNLVLKQHMERWKWKESCGVALNFCFSLM